MLPKSFLYALNIQDSNPSKIIFRKWFIDLQVNPTSQWCLQVAVHVDSSQWFLEQLLSLSCSPLCRMIEGVFASQWGGMSVYGCPLELSPVAGLTN